MGFYTEPAFFILAAVAALPAIVLGCLGKSQRVYGLVVSIGFLCLLFWGGSAQEAAFFVAFIALSCILQAVVLRVALNPTALPVIMPPLGATVF